MIVTKQTFHGRCTIQPDAPVLAGILPGVSWYPHAELHDWLGSRPELVGAQV